MKSLVFSAPGKLHLIGEHVVVYGKPAIIAAVNKRCFIKISKRNDKKIEIISKNLEASKIVSLQEIFQKSTSSQKEWEDYIKTNNDKILKRITIEPLDYATICIGEALKYLEIKREIGFTIEINSDIQIGSGMGSSGALSVAIAGSLSKFFLNKFDKSIVNEIAFLSEQKKHGLPSGGDNSTSCFGGFIWFRKESPLLKIIQPLPFTFNKEIKKKFIAIDSGKPNETTGEMVNTVRILYQKSPEKLDEVFSDQEALTRNFLSAISTNDEEKIIETINVCERNLERLRVTSPFSREIIRGIEEIGGAAKICGGGGKTNGTGIILSYHKEKEKLENLLESKNLPYFDVSLGTEGLRQENSE